MRPTTLVVEDFSTKGGRALLELFGSLWTPKNETAPHGFIADADTALFGATNSAVPNCDNIVDVFVYLVINHRWLELTSTLMLMAALVCFITFCSFYLGMKIKPRAPAYWKHRTWNPWSDNFESEVDVTKELLEPVQRLLNHTTKREFMGQGRDGAWVSHRGFRVLRITRIENGKLWSLYARTRRSIRSVSASVKMLAPAWKDYASTTLGTIEKVYADRESDSQVKSFINSLHLDSDRNERLLFHGSPAKGARQQETGMVLFPEEDCSPVFAIKKTGFDERLGNVKGMYGSGTYFADMASKADQYAGQYNPPGTPNGTVGEVATMFLSRVVLGCPYRTDQSLEQLRRPPCLHGHFDLNLYWNEEVQFGKPWRDKAVPFQICDHQRFDSVMGDFIIDGKPRNYREFVVYERQCYPEFCVTYERIL